jgi:alanyl-tRNA synthetase
MMSHEELRRQFHDFFLERDHTLVPSASLVPRDDPSLLFTTAGMVQFKQLYSTTGELPYRRAISVQKCLRAGGKDSDLENVGVSPRHCTFFEMMGHFSFGDYFKPEAVDFAWRFFKDLLGVDTSRLWVSVFEEDDEAAECWKKVGFPAERIVRLGAADNFWGPAGSTGACGPSSEIYWDLGEEHASGQIGGGPGLDDRYIEIWNEVFPQYDQQLDGSRPPLPNRGIDMGAGLERVALMVQGKSNIFETDLFQPIMAGIRELTGYDGPEEGDAQVALRRVADHARALAFTLQEGLVPSNVGRGYVLRRILRRAMMALRTLDVHEPMLYRVLGLVGEHMGGVYPELLERAERSALTVKSEEERFLRTIEQGLGRYRELVAGVPDGGELPGAEVFKLYSTFGIPWEMTREMAEEKGLSVDEAGYQEALAADRKLSQQASSFAAADPGTEEAVYEALVPDAPASEFMGYETLESKVRVTEWRELGDGTLELVLDRSPFYATSGGQVADKGEITLQGRGLAVDDVQRRGSRLCHRVALPEGLDSAAAVQGFRERELGAVVDARRRRAIARAHTATHLLHAALHRVIGEEATQAGSWVGPDIFRFDFNHFRGLSPEELSAVEEQVTEWVLENLPVRHETMDIKEAMNRGAMALFGEKYGDRVRVVSVGDISMELCGGTHLVASGAIGPFLIKSESSVASGVRRIEVLTGLAAQAAVAGGRRSLAALIQRLRVPEEELDRSVAELAADRQKLRKELEALRAKQAAARSDELLSPAGEYGGLKLLRGELEAENPKEIRGMADSIRGKLGESVGVLLAQAGGKTSFVILLPDKLVAAGHHAGKLTSGVAAAIGGRGGGSPTLAQAGLTDSNQFADVLTALGEALELAGNGEES